MSKGPTVQAILAQWHTNIVHGDFWPRAVHQTLIDAAAEVLPDGTRPEKAEHRTLAVEALHHGIGGKARSIVGRLAQIEAWLSSRPEPRVIASKFSDASRYARAF